MPPDRGTCPGTPLPRSAETASTTAHTVNWSHASHSTQMSTPRRASTLTAPVRTARDRPEGRGGGPRVSRSRAGIPRTTASSARPAPAERHAEERSEAAGARNR